MVWKRNHVIYSGYILQQIRKLIRRESEYCMFDLQNSRKMPLTLWDDYKDTTHPRTIKFHKKIHTHRETDGGRANKRTRSPTQEKQVPNPTALGCNISQERTSEKRASTLCSKFQSTTHRHPGLEKFVP